MIAVFIIVSISAIQYYNSLVFTDTNISKLYEDEDLFFSTARMFMPLPELLQDNSAMEYSHKRYNNGKEYVCLTQSYEPCENPSAINEQEITYNEYWLKYKSDPLFLAEPSEVFFINDTLYDGFIVFYEGTYYFVAIGQNSKEHRITYLFVEDEYLSHTSPADLIPQYYP